MKEVLIWLMGFALIFVMFFGLIHQHNKIQSRTLAEYERDVKESGVRDYGNAMIKAGFLELEKLLKPSLTASISYLADEQQGETKQKHGEGDDDHSSELIKAQ